jgi:hypothetical protein
LNSLPPWIVSWFSWINGRISREDDSLDGSCCVVFVGDVVVVFQDTLTSCR